MDTEMESASSAVVDIGNIGAWLENRENSLTGAVQIFLNAPRRQSRINMRLCNGATPLSLVGEWELR
jgi:hypothetical protein